MGNRHVLLPAVLCTTVLAAQTLDQANNAPVPGQYFTFHQTNNVPPGPGGANQVWDFSNMPTGAPVFFNYMAPAATPFGAVFPNATVAMLDVHNDYRYMQATSSGIDLLGHYSSMISSLIIYQDPEKTMGYPCGYGCSWSDNFSSNFSSSGTPVVRTGTINGLADGYGTIMMPSGTYGNVLRVRTIEDYTDVVAGGLYIINYLFTHYSWYLPGTPVPLMSVHDQVTTTNGVPSPVLFARYLTSSPLGSSAEDPITAAVSIYPNPARDRVEVAFGSSGSAYQLEVVDATGRVVLTDGPAGHPPGIGRITLEVGGLSSGVYTARLRDAQGTTTTGRFVVE
ncbi:MAG: T9SS type A sorting domain-containing protein [Flavobacteriales bacterium]|nr:T9SS type A sorting domain-containing protein [Flavobacteriales bacterium]